MQNILNVFNTELAKPKRNQVREPYTREELAAIYDKQIEAEAKHWGEDYIYTRWAREAKVKKLEEFDAGKVVKVRSEEYHADGMDWANHYYSDGTIDRSCYGYAD